MTKAKQQTLTHLSNKCINETNEKKIIDAEYDSRKKIINNNNRNEIKDSIIPFLGEKKKGKTSMFKLCLFFCKYNQFNQTVVLLSKKKKKNIKQILFFCSLLSIEIITSLLP